MPRPVASRSDRQSVHETIFRAMSQRKRLALWYRERDGGPVVATKLGLYRLARNRQSVVSDRAFRRPTARFESSRSPGSSASS